MSLVIKIHNLSKIYRLGEIGTGTLSRDLERWFKMKILRREDPYLQIGENNEPNKKGKSDLVYSLRNINLEINQGEAIGIIGRNGAGKSTLLKIISRVTSPTNGKVYIKGRIGSLLEVGTGFHPELTGTENIFLNGAILGMRKKEITRKLDEIVDFSGIERYIDTPVKRYSSGMYVRLAFAVAAYLESEILIVDEVLAVGDAEFQKKCLGKMGDVSKLEGRTILFVSHNMAAVSQLCSNGVLLQNGRVVLQAEINKTISTYLSVNTSSTFYIADVMDKSHKDAYFNEIRIVDNEGKDKSNFLITEPISISFNIKINRNQEMYTVFCMILNHSMSRVFAAESEYLEENMTLRINPNFLVRGKYSIHAFIHIPRKKQEDIVENICQFEVFDNSSFLAKHGGYDYGAVFGNYSWIR